MWASELLWTQWRREKFPTPNGNQTPETPIIQPVAIPAALPRLTNPSKYGKVQIFGKSNESKL
jgi:hypothetical protein